MVHSSWQESIQGAYGELSDGYRTYLEQNLDYFPSQEHCFNAFKTLPKEKVRYILFGQDPYPRQESAIGYAFIDGKVTSIFSDTGLSKEVNRATSLRNFIKMLLVARGDLLADNTSQEVIMQVNKKALIGSIGEFKDNFERNGVLLLNTALIFSHKSESKSHIKSWQPFIERLLDEMQAISPTLILFGVHAKALKKLDNIHKFHTIELEHPYNHTFICNQEALKLFGPMNLLAK